MSEEYGRYLASREWALKREAVRKRSGNRCERCKVGPQDAVHHLTYTNLYNEPLDDLMAICQPCHAFLSAKSDVDPLENATDELRDEMRDRHLVISIRRTTRCVSCGFDTEGSYVLCAICRNPTCDACTFTYKDEVRCINHYDTPSREEW